jgi:hypothetical protein
MFTPLSPENKQRIYTWQQQTRKSRNLSVVKSHNKIALREDTITLNFGKQHNMTPRRLRNTYFASQLNSCWVLNVYNHVYFHFKQKMECNCQASRDNNMKSEKSFCLGISRFSRFHFAIPIPWKLRVNVSGEIFTHSWTKSYTFIYSEYW